MTGNRVRPFMAWVWPSQGHGNQLLDRLTFENGGNSLVREWERWLGTAPILCSMGWPKLFMCGTEAPCKTQQSFFEPLLSVPQRSTFLVVTKRAEYRNLLANSSIFLLFHAYQAFAGTVILCYSTPCFIILAQLQHKQGPRLSSKFHPDSLSLNGAKCNM